MKHRPSQFNCALGEPLLKSPTWQLKTHLPDPIRINTIDGISYHHGRRLRNNFVYSLHDLSDIIYWFVGFLLEEAGSNNGVRRWREGYKT